jgi:hypothetical protein
METVVTVLGSITAAFITAYVTTMWRLRREHELDIDTELRTARIEAFKRPWETLKVLSLHNVEAPTRRDLDHLVTELTNWYYDEGGVYLTRRSQPAFVACTKSIRAVAGKDAQSGGHGQETIDEAVHRELYDLGSAFRTQMTLDLGSRFESDFKSQRHVQYRSEAETKTKNARQALNQIEVWKDLLDRGVLTKEEYEVEISKMVRAT